MTPDDIEDRFSEPDAEFPNNAFGRQPDSSSDATSFDPLFEWEEARFADEAAFGQQDDVLWLTESEWRPSPVTRPSPPAFRSPPPWVPATSPAISALQQQITQAPAAPRPSPRSQGIQVALIGLALLVLGAMALANGVGGAPLELKIITYSALIVGALLTSAGVAGATFELPLPLPGVVTMREVAETVLLAVLIFLAVRASFQNFKVEGASMQPSLHNDQYLIVNKLSYAGIDLSMFDFLPFVDANDDDIFHLWDSPSFGDVIVFHAPESPSRDFIKRIIGTPGDTIEINSSTGQVAVNGSFLEESYIQGTTNCSVSCTWTVPPRDSEEARTRCGSNACYFVLGDNRQNSSDSRSGWLVPEENIIGKALITYWDDGEVNVDLAPNHSVQFASEAAAQE